MRRNKAILLLLFVSGIVFCNGQTLRFDWKKDRREILFGGGANNFLGDLGGANQIGTNGLRDFDLPAIRPNFIAGYRYRLSKRTAVQSNLVYAVLYGNDKLTLEPFRNNRNCNFRTTVVELSAQFEYTIVRERVGARYPWLHLKGWRYIQESSYLFAGIGLMYFNPKGERNGEWYALRPLCTEGEGLISTRPRYSLVQLVIPFGIGFKFALSEKWSVGIEYGIRKTFTDYLDDVSKTYVDPAFIGSEKGWMAEYFSNPTNNTLGPNVTAPGYQRGDPRDKDSYMFSFISFYYKIPKHKRTLPKYR